MASLWTRLNRAGTPASVEHKMAQTHSIFTHVTLDDDWNSGSSCGASGFQRNPVVHRCIRLIVEAATSVPLAVREGGQIVSDHDLASLLRNPNAHQSIAQLFEQAYAHLYTYGNAYLQAAQIEGRLRAIYALRPDRVTVEAGADGWPNAYLYRAGGKSIRLPQNEGTMPHVVHIRLFNPVDDHYGYSPASAAQTAIDIHDSAQKWNRALLKNAARPSGALVYSAAGGQLTDAQFKRLKDELEAGYQGATNAGRPMVLEGGLDWKTMALTPRDMDFIEAKHSAARDIALAFGVPPQLLGIPGDNSYANYAEANRAFWRHVIVPLVRKVADALTGWVQPLYGDDTAIVPQLDSVDALTEDQSAKWARIDAASFLTDTEKRMLLGLPAGGDHG